MPIQIEDITPSAHDATDYKLVRRGSGTFEMALVADTLTVTWGDITGPISGNATLQAALDAKAETAHTHIISNVTGLQAALDAKSAVGHGHVIADVTGLQTALDGKALLAHTHVVSDITGTKAQFDTAVTDGDFLYVGDVTSNANHTGDATGSTALTLATVNGNVGAFGSATQVATFTVNAKGLTTAAANVAIQIAESQVTSLVADLALKAPLASPTFTGTVTLPAGQVVNGVTLTTGGGTTNFLRADGSYAAPPGGAPGGSNTQIQFNDSSAFGGDANLTWDKTNNILGLTGTPQIDMAVKTTAPSAPATDTASIFPFKSAGRSRPAWVEDKFGLAFAQTALDDGRFRFEWRANAATGGTVLGNAVSTAGTYVAAFPTFASVGLLSWIYRATYANVITTVNQVIGVGSVEALMYRSTTAGANGGFSFYARWGFDTWTNGGRVFMGLSASGSAPLSNDPSTQDNICGFTVDAADNGLINFSTKSTAAVNKVSTGLTIVNNKGYDTWFFCPADGSAIYWRIRDCATGTVVEGSSATSLPTVNTRLAIVARTSNAALTAATAVRLSLTNIYVESAI